MKHQFEEQLQELIADYKDSDVLKAAAYSLLGDGKRVRPLLLFNLISDYGEDPYLGVDAALALEMIQTYSLVHDDLPAMDDDDFRRGAPSNHIVFGEAVAILAGDGLLTGAFHVLSNSNYDADKIVQLVALFSHHAGMNGMILGQTLDLKYEQETPHSLDDLLCMYDLKTGSLLATALEAAAILVSRDKDREILREVGYKCGRAFQIQDDIFDVIKTKEELGKTVGSDHANEKVTVLSFMDIEQATELVARLYGEVRDYLSTLRLSDHKVYEMIEYLMSRKS